MILEIKLDSMELEMKILQKGKTIDFEKAKYYHDLSKVLISCLDKLLIRTNIDIKSLKSYKILSNLGQDSSSYKIASAFVEGLKVSS